MLPLPAHRFDGDQPPGGSSERADEDDAAGAHAAVVVLDGNAFVSRLLGSSSRAAEILGGRRELSKAMIRTLAEKWGLDANTPIGVRRAA